MQPILTPLIQWLWQHLGICSSSCLGLVTSQSVRFQTAVFHILSPCGELEARERERVTHIGTETGRQNCFHVAPNLFLKLSRRGCLGITNTEESAEQIGRPAPLWPRKKWGWLWYSPGTRHTVLRLKAFYSPWPFPCHLSSEKSSLRPTLSQWQAIPMKTKGQVVGWHKVNTGNLFVFEHIT